MKTPKKSVKKEVLYLNIGGFIIELCFKKYEEDYPLIDYFISMTKKYYKDFFINYKAERINHKLEIIYKRTFRILQNTIKKTIFINFYEEGSSKKSRAFYHVSGSQFQFIIRKITHELLIKNNGFILHASAVKKNNKAYVFLGDSGAGKSTIMTSLSPEFTPMGDDTVIIRKQDDIYYCYCSSASEKNAWFTKSTDRAPLDKVFFLRKKNIMRLIQLENKEKVTGLLGKQVYSDIDNLSNQFVNITTFINSFNKFYILDFVLRDKIHLRNIITE